MPCDDLPSTLATTPSWTLSGAGIGESLLSQAKFLLVHKHRRFLIISIMWQAVEVLCYGAVQGRTVDSIIVMVFAVALKELI